MRGKKAKQLRKSVENPSEVKYEHLKFNKFWFDRNDNKHPYQVYTRYLYEFCGRAIYQKAKKVI